MIQKCYISILSHSFLMNFIKKPVLLSLSIILLNLFSFWIFFYTEPAIRAIEKNALLIRKYFWFFLLNIRVKMCSFFNRLALTPLGKIRFGNTKPHNIICDRG